MKFQWVTLILVLWPCATLQSDANSSSYMAAIVEYSPIISSDEGDNLGKLNADNYLKIIDKAISYGIDIIVFPESSLSISTSENATIKRSQGASYIPDPDENVVPCSDTTNRYEYSLTSMSCAAKDHKIYVLINHREKVDCIPGEGCPADAFLIYNTNVAFDRHGQVIARYRKYHLFGEYDKNITEAIPTTFKTDFNVTFGTFICFDLLFQTPALNLTRDLGITDILYPTHWFSELPYLYAVEAQAAWAYANDVNLLASSYNYPRTGSGGGGIFLGKQRYVKVISENKRSNILVVAEIPKVINGKRKQNIDEDKIHVYEFNNKEITTGEELSSDATWTYMRDDLSVYSLKLIDIKKRIQNETVCNRGYCCNFKVTVDFDETKIKNDSNYYHYQFAVFNGTRIHDVATGGIKSCGIIACINNTRQGCAHIFHDNKNTVQPTTFTSLVITTPSVTNDNTLFLPITFSQNMIPLNVTDFSYESYSDSCQFSIHRMELKKPLNNLLTFALHGRDFIKDGTEVTRGLSSTLIISPMLLSTAIITYVLFYSF